MYCGLSFRPRKGDHTRRIAASRAFGVKSKPVYPLDSVAADLRAAIAHYSTWRSDAEARVIAKYEETVSWIAWNPTFFRRYLALFNERSSSTRTTLSIFCRKKNVPSFWQCSTDAWNHAPFKNA